MVEVAQHARGSTPNEALALRIRVRHGEPLALRTRPFHTVAAVIGRAKTFTYIGLVALFSTVAGLGYGAWVDAGQGVWR